jgi:hypothetical protein|tara:strand:- start:571 stop:774 length:204 start_codon:yes stop_codon:yes gene_type:complete
MIVFNNIDKADGFEAGVEEANKKLIEIGIKLEYNFITSYVGVDGEYAYSLTVEKVKEFDDGKQLHLL